MHDPRDPTLIESEKKVITFNGIDLNYDKALQLIAEWWETIKSEGINVAAEVQRRRSELQKK